MAQKFDTDKFRIDCLEDTTNDTILEPWKHLTPKMQKIQDGIYDSLSLDDMTLSDKCMVSSKMVGNWIGTFYGEKRFLEKLREKRLVIIDELIDLMIKGKNKKPRYSLQDEALLNPKVKALDRVIKEQEELIIFFNEHLRNLKQFGFNIKAAVDLVKLDN